MMEYYSSYIQILPNLFNGRSAGLVTFVLATLVFVCYHLSMNTDINTIVVSTTSNPVKLSGLTIVTALFDIGDHQKGEGGSVRRSSDYLKWMESWAKITSNVVFYTNKADYEDEFMRLRLRHGFPTRTVLTDFEWTAQNSNTFHFLTLSLLPNITGIFRRPNYPHHHPNTVLPLYSVIMHGKYDMLEHTIFTNPFQSEYFVWIDVGIYRDYPPDGPCFGITLPPAFNSTKIAVTQISDFQSNQAASDIITDNRVWVAGGTVFGRKDTFLKYIDQLRRVMGKMLEIGWISTDQQTILAMYADQSLNVSSNIQLQPYRTPQWGIPAYSSDEWFYLAYLTRKDETCPNLVDIER